MQNEKNVCSSQLYVYDLPLVDVQLSELLTPQNNPGWKYHKTPIVIIIMIILMLDLVSEARTI